MNPLITAEEAAEILKVTPQTIRAYINKGKLPAAKIGRGYLIEVDDLLDFYNAHKVQA